MLSEVGVAPQRDTNAVEGPRACRQRRWFGKEFLCGPENSN
jgi:hypothetical protein